MKKLGLLLLLLSQLISNAFADPELIKLFKDTFVSGYESGRCGDNITGFVTKADAKRINLNQANILLIENKGFSMFGMVNVEYARDRKRDGGPGPMNWSHHVVLEKDGLIYDFDFGSAAQVTDVNTYFAKMWLSELDKGTSDFVRAAEKLKDYEVEILPANDMLSARRNRTATPDGLKMRLNQYLMPYGR